MPANASKTCVDVVEKRPPLTFAANVGRHTTAPKSAKRWIGNCINTSSSAEAMSVVRLDNDRFSQVKVAGEYTGLITALFRNLICVLE